MKKTLGKWEQSVLLERDPFVAKHIPETLIYSDKNLVDLLDRHSSVYVKHDSTGQGKAIFKVHTRNDGTYYVNGFTIQGKPIQKSISSVDEMQQLLHPFLKLGRKSGPYIIQEAIQSITQNGQPFSIRVHVQKLQNDWVIGGILGNIAAGPVVESGIVNRCRGATLIAISKLLSQTVSLQADIVKELEQIAISAARTIHSALPCREYGIDFGINQEGTPILFEVNTMPGISGFAQINMDTWKRIVEIRKLQNES